MKIKMKLIFIFGFLYVGQSCLQNGVSNKCNCIGQRSCRQCSANLYSTDGSHQSKQYSAPSQTPLPTHNLEQQQELEQSQLQQLPRPSSSESLQQYPPPDNIYLPDYSLSNIEDNAESTTTPTTTLYPSQEYANMIYGNNFYFKQQNSNFEESDSPLSRPLTSEFQTNQNTIIDDDSYFKIPPNSDNQIPYEKLEILERPVSPYSPPPPPLEVPCPQNTEDCIMKNVTAEKKPDPINPLALLAPALSAGGVGVGLINYFRPNPVVPEIQKLKDDIYERLERIDQALSSNQVGMALQSDDFSLETSKNNDSNFYTEIEVKMNSLRKNYELYLNEPNQFHTNSFKNICLDPSSNPVTIIGAAEAFLSFKKMDLQLENDLYSDENIERIKILYQKIFDELILLYRNCETVINGPENEKQRTKTAETLKKNFNSLLGDFKINRISNVNLNHNLTVEDIENV